MESSELVPGDVIVVKFGDVVPADMKLLGDEDGEDDQPMLIDQASACELATGCLTQLCNVIDRILTVLPCVHQWLDMGKGMVTTGQTGTCLLRVSALPLCKSCMCLMA